jgi:hypothetical protein
MWAAPAQMQMRIICIQNANDSHFSRCTPAAPVVTLDKCKNSGLAPRRPQVRKLGLVVQAHMPYNCYIKTRKALWIH